MEMRGLLVTYTKPSPPVTMILRTSGSGSKLVWPVSSGAVRQRPLSMKKRESRLVGAAVYINEVACYVS